MLLRMNQQPAYQSHYFQHNIYTELPNNQPYQSLLLCQYLYLFLQSLFYLESLPIAILAQVHYNVDLSVAMNA